MFNVPEAGRYRLQRAPLAQALVQVSFPLLARFQTLEGVASLQEHLIDLLPYMERQQVGQMALTISPQGTFVPGPQENTVVWKFTDDSGWTLAVTPGSATLAVIGAKYQGVADFAKRFAAVLNALMNMDGAAKVQRCDLLQVRYIDVVESPSDDPKAWSRWFQPGLTGWAGDGIMDKGTTLLSQLVQTQLTASLDWGGGEQIAVALIRHGLLPQGSVIPGVPSIPFFNVTLGHVAYTIDMDLSIQHPQQFIPATLTAQFKALHARIDTFFRWALTAEGANNFGLEELA